jgi:hypothetical protein
MDTKTRHQARSGPQSTWWRDRRPVSTAAATTPAPTTRADAERRPPRIRRIHRRGPQLTQVIPGDARDRSFYPVARLLDLRRVPDAVRCSAPGRDGLTFWGGDDPCSRSGAFRVFAGERDWQLWRAGRPANERRLRLRGTTMNRSRTVDLCFHEPSAGTAREAAVGVDADEAWTAARASQKRSAVGARHVPVSRGWRSG